MANPRRHHEPGSGNGCRGCPATLSWNKGSASLCINMPECFDASLNCHETTLLRLDRTDARLAYIEAFLASLS
jgi:hypothetical protein